MSDLRKEAKAFHKVFKAMGWTWRNLDVKPYYDYIPSTKQILETMKSLKKSVLARPNGLSSHTGRIAAVKSCEYLVDFYLQP